MAAMFWASRPLPPTTRPHSCWAIIGDNVYDLTDWIDSHPGGASRIVGLCGTDGTSQFQGQHGGSSSAQGTLERYLLGAVGDPIP
jgi:cytochrome b involved in lipid metabolism